MPIVRLRLLLATSVKRVIWRRLISASAMALLTLAFTCYASAAIYLEGSHTSTMVTAIAGSGLSGYRDGPARDAQFVFPTALAYDRHGNLYVADTGAQRIRIVSAGGAVRTLAGGGAAKNGGLWYEGGYLDGAGDIARFSSPSGIAIGGNGVVYVADTGNHCIRRIAKDGTVSTFVKLGLPRGLAFDARGYLYVADAQLGMQRVSPDGTVSQLASIVRGPLGVAIFNDAEAYPLVFATDGDGIAISRGGIGGYRFNVLGRRTGGSPVEGEEPIGSPFQLSALNSQGVAYTDPASNTVRYIDVKNGIAAVIAGDVGSDKFGGSYRNGSGLSARFNSPTGIAVAKDGSIAVADSANHRIRRIAGFDSRSAITISAAVEQLKTGEHYEAAFPPPRSKGRDYRILYLGDSFVWWDTVWDTSIAGLAERYLRSTVHEVPITFVTMRFTGAQLPALSSYLENLADTGLADAVVLQLHAGMFENTIDDIAWTRATGAQLSKLQLELAAAHMPLFVVSAPIALELGPSETPWLKIRQNSLAPSIFYSESAWQRMLGLSGVPNVNLWDRFTEEVMSPQHRALYGSTEEHLSPFGRMVVARAIAEKLQRDHPWIRRERPAK